MIGSHVCMQIFPLLGLSCDLRCQVDLLKDDRIYWLQSGVRFIAVPGTCISSLDIISIAGNLLSRHPLNQEDVLSNNFESS